MVRNILWFLKNHNYIEYAWYIFNTYFVYVSKFCMNDFDWTKRKIFWQSFIKSRFYKVDPVTPSTRPGRITRIPNLIDRWRHGFIWRSLKNRLVTYILQKVRKNLEQLTTACCKCSLIICQQYSTTKRGRIFV